MRTVLGSTRRSARYAARVACHPDANPDIAAEYARIWRAVDPYDPDAADAEIAAVRRQGGDTQTLAAAIGSQMRQAEIDWKAAEHPVSATASGTDVSKTSRRLVAQQKTEFCKAPDGTTIAYGVIGDGPPLVKAANWLSHLELDWDTPWSPLFKEIARDHRFIRYDERGNGLSDWDVADISFEKFVEDLETVVDQLGLDRFPLLGMSQGAAVDQFTAELRNFLAD